MKIAEEKAPSETAAIAIIQVSITMLTFAQAALGFASMPQHCHDCPTCPAFPLTTTDDFMSMVSWMGHITTPRADWLHSLGPEKVMPQMQALMSTGAVGSHTALIAEATDFKYSPLCDDIATCVPQDGNSGDVDFPYANIKVVATMVRRPPGQ